ncbi:MAG: hypothetical protein WCH76_04325 [Candidatus Riflemargulisbacteria bacterium]
MVGKERFNKRKNSSRVSVFVSDDKNSETIDAKEVDMKIIKLNSMIKGVERRIEAHERKLSNMYDSKESRETREHIQQAGTKMGSGR